HQQHQQPYYFPAEASVLLAKYSRVSWLASRSCNGNDSAHFGSCTPAIPSQQCRPQRILPEQHELDLKSEAISNPFSYPSRSIAAATAATAADRRASEIGGFHAILTALERMEGTTFGLWSSAAAAGFAAKVTSFHSRKWIPKNRRK
ncbi:hypothetical protein HKX48_002037, partial [Thoreauomyces humboldtii]